MVGIFEQSVFLFEYNWKNLFWMKPFGKMILP